MRAHLFLFIILFIGIPLAITSCGEDRSDEQPFAPEVSTLPAVQSTSSTALLYGLILSSRNSHLTACGFIWGEMTEVIDTVRTDSAQTDSAQTYIRRYFTAADSHTLALDSVPVISTSPHITTIEAVSYSARLDSLAPGTYFSIAYATNGIGTTRGDTVVFTIK